MSWADKLLEGLVNVICGVSIIAGGYVIGHALNHLVEYLWTMLVWWETL